MKTFIQRLFSKKRQMPDHLRAGAWGERIAEKELKKLGMKIIGKRVRFGRRFELDLVARDKDTLVFVEVKTRRSEKFGRPFSAVDRAKRRQISKAAIRYLERLRKLPDYIRFDVVEVVGEQGKGEPSVNHIENAFTLDRSYRLPFPDPQD